MQQMNGQSPSTGFGQWSATQYDEQICCLLLIMYSI